MAEVQPQLRPRDSIDNNNPDPAATTEEIHDRAAAMAHDESAHGKFAGGFDTTPIPQAPPGYTLKFTFHRGINLPFGDFGSFSSDPYIVAQLIVDLPQRHKQDPKVSFRTPTVRKNTDPIWDCEWIVANVPTSGFELKCCVYDEDPADHDDKLGNAYIEAHSLDDDWPGLKEQSFKIKKRMAGKRVHFFGNIASLASRRHDTSAYLVVSVECLGRTPGTEGGQMYTVGPNHWFKHFSPLIGRLAGTKDEVQSHSGEKAISRYKFVSILPGPDAGPTLTSL